jgi:TolB protein
MYVIGQTLKQVGRVAVAAAGVVGAVALAPASAQAGTPAPAKPAATAKVATATAASTKAASTKVATAKAGTIEASVAYVRGGDVFVGRGAVEARLTSDGGWSRPRYSPDGQSLALLRGGQLWVMKADGSGKRLVTSRPAAGPSWSPDGRWLAFASLSCSGGPGVYKIDAVAANASPEAVFPAYCRGEEMPAATVAQQAAGKSLEERLSKDDAVAWSPDGTKMAFRGGDCESIYDACLSVGNLITGGEKPVAAYGGGSRQNSGFAVVPSWSPDGAKLAWTAYEEGETAAGNKPVHVVEYDVASGQTRTVGAGQDRELTYAGTKDSAYATGTYRNSSWVMAVNLNNNGRTAKFQGSQPSVQPVK